MLCTYISFYEWEPLKYPETKQLFLICPCVSTRDKSSLQMASAVEEHLNPISNHKTQMDHKGAFVLKEAQCQSHQKTHSHIHQSGDLTQSEVIEALKISTVEE
ncbi:hypothetical protein CHARACLAT_019815 [Characodon lateralis]|uniref:Uncharacterized protein n=1 Tax=Characodon lateralis TaxID=208331 RepID=A0ABU7F531_9TELE|nr:hypothetical protein [Characodon lateralis]